MQLRMLCTATTLLSLIFLSFCNLAWVHADAYERLPYGAKPLNGEKLIFAHVIFRHGDRTPIDPYPNDPWGRREYWTTGWGQLTNHGKQQHYKLGKWLRQRYQLLLNETYSKDEIYVQSTDVDRTLMSASANLAGLYQPVGSDVWNQNVTWQPIPVHTIPDKFDWILSSKVPCSAYDYALAELKNSAEFQKLNERLKYLFDYLTKYSGRTIDSLEGIQRINNTFFIETINNKTLPEWTKKVYPSADMTFATNLAFAVGTYTRLMARLKAGPLINEVFNRFSKKLEKKLEPNRVVWVYSAHDTTIANVLNALKLFDRHSPPYTACIMIELRLDSANNPFVSIFYKNTTSEPKPMYIPECGIACPLNKMFTLYKDILPEDWEHECKLSTMMMTYEEANIGQASAILIVIVLIMLCLSYLLMVYYRSHNYRFYSTYSQMA